MSVVKDRIYVYELSHCHKARCTWECLHLLPPAPLVKDGGEGHVGSVRRFDTLGEAIVVWDSGIVANYRCGTLGFDLRVLDTAPSGLKHPGTICEGCNQVRLEALDYAILLANIEQKQLTQKHIQNKHIFLFIHNRWLFAVILGLF